MSATTVLFGTLALVGVAYAIAWATGGETARREPRRPQAHPADAVALSVPSPLPWPRLWHTPRPQGPGCRTGQLWRSWLGVLAVGGGVPRARVVDCHGVATALR